MATAPLPLLLTLCAVLAATCATKLQDGRFKVAPSVLKDIVFSAPQLAFRLGSGAFVNGYKVGVVKDEVKDDYSFIRSFGFKLQEKSAAFVARPVKPIEMYEFESCPFCRKYSIEYI